MCCGGQKGMRLQKALQFRGPDAPEADSCRMKANAPRGTRLYRSPLHLSLPGVAVR